jgi:hypothetical protein
MSLRNVCTCLRLYTVSQLRTTSIYRIIACEFTERHGRVVNTPTSYSGGPGFKTQSRLPAILIEVFLGFTQPLQSNSGIVP